MIDLPAPFRPAGPRDADAVATFFNIANEGLGAALWQVMCPPGETPEDVGRSAMATRIENGEVVGSDDPGAPLAGMISHALPLHVAPLPSDLPAPLHVTQGLRQRVPGT